MTFRPTPETDKIASHVDINKKPYLMSWIPTDFARDLERQRDDTKDKLDKAEASFKALVTYCNNLEKKLKTFKP